MCASFQWHFSTSIIVAMLSDGALPHMRLDCVRLSLILFDIPLMNLESFILIFNWSLDENSLSWEKKRKWA
jgi:hypothetical protein